MISRNRERGRIVPSGLFRAFVGSLCALALALAGSAAPAVASRQLETTIGGFNTPNGVALDGSDNLWATDFGSFADPTRQGLYEYGPFPSHTLLGAPTTARVLEGILDLGVAVEEQSGELFVAAQNGRTVYIYSPSSPSNPCKPGEPVCYTHSWTRINSVSGGSGLHIAIDNSQTYSRGRVYLSLTIPENDVEALDAERRPVQFPAEAAYIEGNRITGTPEGPFGQVAQISVDDEGNIYVTDRKKAVIDMFDSSGLFVRSLPAPWDEGSGANGASVDPTNGNILVTTRSFENFEGEGSVLEYDRHGNLLDAFETGGGGSSIPQAALAVNSNGYVYVPMTGSSIEVFGPAAPMPTIGYSPVGNPTQTSAVLRASVDPNGGGAITECKFQFGNSTAYGEEQTCAPDPNAAPPGSNFSSPTSVSAPMSVPSGATYHYRVVVHNANGTYYGADQVYSSQPVLALRTDPASAVGESAATLHGAFYGNGEETHYYFEWGRTPAYGTTTAAPPGDDAGAPSGEESLEAELTGLSPYGTYHFRVVASNGGEPSYGEDRVFTTTPGVPTVRRPAASAVHADRALVRADVNPNGAPTSVRFQYLTDAEYQGEGWTNAQEVAAGGIGMGKLFRPATAQLSGLAPGTLYRYRVIASNDAGEVSAEATFKTFPFIPSIEDACPNAHVRQQTGSALLLDCRGYELVSAADSGGYDVESSLVPGQTPFGGYPDAADATGQPRVLYGAHFGAIPGPWNPTNHGVDPYVATRTEGGWRTQYAGIPADGTPSNKPFASALAGADAKLDTFAFGGPQICSPCFADGKSGIPVREADGELVQGMAGSEDPGADALPDGFVADRLSADGSHLVFASSSRFEPDGNENGDISVYDRNLATDTTHVVSKTPDGVTMTGSGIGEVAISNDGSRILFGQLLSEEGDARFWHLYMNVGDSDHSIDLMPESTSGALFDGMTADGSKVFFTSFEQLVPADEDTSADIYEADVTASGSSLELISTGSEETGNGDDCEPAGNTAHEFWNTRGSDESCDVVAIGGGGGVASGDGTIYFLSPELLDGPDTGVADAPNLYVRRPGGPARFVATLESSANAPLPESAHPFRRAFGSFVRPGGVAIDHSNGDVYVYDVENSAGFDPSYVYKYDSSGHAIQSFGESGRLTISNNYGSYNLPTQLAVDNNPASPSYRDLYVPELLGGRVLKFDPSGEHLSDLNGVPFASGVATDPTDGDVYALSFFGGVFTFAADGTPGTAFPTSASELPTALAVDSSGKVYVVNGGGTTTAKGTTEIYDSTGTHLGQLTNGPARSVAVDPFDDHVYVDEEDDIREFDSAGEPVGLPIGAGRFSESFGVAVDEGTLQVTNPGGDNVVSFGPRVTPPSPGTDSVIAIHSVSAPSTRFTGDFQVNPSGRRAAFVTNMPLSEFDNASHGEVYLYDALPGGLACVSCNPTEEQASGEQTLPPNGLGLAEDGRVFFNSTEGLVDRDLNGEEDAYEWVPNGFDFGHGAPICQKEAGCTELISTGSSSFPARLLSISRDATDAYFFTRDRLSEQDENGSTVKLYDARELGGFPFVPAPQQCKASDECHGPGTPAPAAPDIKTVASSPGGNKEPTRCKRKFVKRHGKCVRKKQRHHRKQHHRKGHHHG
jgi:hypothetical protein